MIQLYDVTSGRALGELTDADLAFLQEQMEEESSVDQDYYIISETIEMLAGSGASDALLALLRGAVEERGEADIRWADES